MKYFAKDDFTDMGIALADAYKLMIEFNYESKTRLEKISNLMSTARSRQENSKTSLSRKRIKPLEIWVVFTWYNFDLKKGQVHTSQGDNGWRKTCTNYGKIIYT